MNPLSVIKAATSQPTYVGQAVTTLKIPCLTSIITPTAGIAAANVQINVSLIEDFASRFQNCFEEYRILKCIFHISPLGVNAGTTSFWIDESAISAPTALEALAKTSKIVPNSNANGRTVFRMTWIAKDFTDLTFRRTTNTSNTSGTLQVYSDLTNFGGSGTNTALFLVRPVLHVQFRGISPVGGL